MPHGLHELRQEDVLISEHREDEGTAISFGRVSSDHLSWLRMREETGGCVWERPLSIHIRLSRSKIFADSEEKSSKTPLQVLNSFSE